MSPLELTIVAVVLLAGAGIFAWATRRAASEASRGSSGFLCDRCKYNDARYCTQPQRPNAHECQEFKARQARH